MKAKYKLTRPQDADATLEVTMPIEDWAKVLKAFDESPAAMGNPLWQFREVISDIIQKAKQVFEAESER